jgi:hypothetical protein
MTKKSFLRRMMPWLIVLLLLAALILFVFVPIYTTQEKTFGRETRVIYFEGDGKPLHMENDVLSFEMDGATTLFEVTDKRSGKVWRSNPKNRDKDSLARGERLEYLSSTLTVSYYDDINLLEMNNYTGSIKNQAFEVFQQEDGSIRVNYSLGKNVGRRYIMPSAITKERYTAFQEKMSKKQKSKIGNYYSQYDPAKLDSKSNKDEIIAMYPSVTEQTLYIMKSDLNTTQKEEIESIFKELGYTEEDYAIDQELLANEVGHSGPVFNVSVIYRLEGNDLVVEVPYDSVCCDVDYPVVYLSTLPFFGAAYKNDEGFTMVPEGSGALIDFNNGKIGQSVYYANLYGWDYATRRDSAVSETDNAFPVFGMSHADGSFICIIEGADSYAGVNADIAGRLNDFNYVYAKYNVLHFDEVKVDKSKSAKKFLMYEDVIPDEVLVQRYKFLDSTGYVEMAEAYGEYLRAKPEMKGESASEEIPVNVELVGAINKKIVKFGLPLNTVIPTTTFKQAEAIIEELTSSGVRDLNVRYTGWCNGGVQQKVLTKVNTLSELGGESGMKKLIDSAKSKDVDLFFDGITCFAYDSDLFDGFVAIRDAARATTKALIKLYPYDIVTYRESDWMDPYYLVKPAYAMKCNTNLLTALSKQNAAGVAFRDLGNLLSADYHNTSLTTREQVKDMHVQELKDADESNLKIMIKEGNAYALPYADVITDMNLSGNAYALLDQSIPFYQIAIHGLKNYTGEAMNLAGDYETLLLESAEYGAGLNFTFMYEDPKVLQDSPFSCYGSSGYSDWKDQAVEMILRYQSEMKGLNRQRIVDHEKLADKVSVTTYSDGTKVYVNYGYEDHTEGDTLVPARDYLVVREAQ